MKHVVLLCTLSLFLFTGCHNVGGGIRLEAGYPHGHHAPPPHALAHGRRHHLYHYYPNAEFYFDVGRNMYFYLDTHGQWSFSVNLPLRYHHHLRSGFVEIEMDHDRPYLRHKHHRSKYKKHNYKYKRKYKAKQKYNNSHKKQRHHNGGFLGDRDDDRYKKKHRKKQGGFLGGEGEDDDRYKKKHRKKQGGFLGGEDDDDDRHKRGRRYDRD